MGNAGDKSPPSQYRPINNSFVYHRLKKFADNTQETDWSVLRRSRFVTSILENWTNGRSFPGSRETLLFQAPIEELGKDRRKFRAEVFEYYHRNTVRTSSLCGVKFFDEF